jgi:hypothetical protein
MLAKPQRIRLSRAKGWRIPPGTVKVDRSTRWGNPFVVGRDGDRARCVQLLEYLLGGGLLCVTTRAPLELQHNYLAHARRNRRHLRGKNLACWCPLDAPCHADVLLRMANPPSPQAPSITEADVPY